MNGPKQGQGGQKIAKKSQQPLGSETDKEDKTHLSGQLDTTEVCLVEVSSQGKTGEVVVTTPTGGFVSIQEGHNYRWSPKLEIPRDGNKVIKVSANTALGKIEWHIRLDLLTSSVMARFLETAEEQTLYEAGKGNPIDLHIEVYKDSQGFHLSGK